MRTVVHLTFESASVKLEWLTDEIITVSNLYSVIRRQGHATGLMRLVCDYADKHAKRAVLLVGQYGDTHGMDNASLVRFYESFGFEIAQSEKEGRVFMERKSQKLHGL